MIRRGRTAKCDLCPQLRLEAVTPNVLWGLRRLERTRPRPTGAPSGTHLQAQNHLLAMCRRASDCAPTEVHSLTSPGEPQATWGRCGRGQRQTKPLVWKDRSGASYQPDATPGTHQEGAGVRPSRPQSRSPRYRHPVYLLPTSRHSTGPRAGKGIPAAGPHPPRGICGYEGHHQNSVQWNCLITTTERGGDRESFQRIPPLRLYTWPAHRQGQPWTGRLGALRSVLENVLQTQGPGPALSAE